MEEGDLWGPRGTGRKGRPLEAEVKGKVGQASECGAQTQQVEGSPTEAVQGGGGGSAAARRAAR